MMKKSDVNKDLLLYFTNSKSEKSLIFNNKCQRRCVEEQAKKRLYILDTENFSKYVKWFSNFELVCQEFQLSLSNALYLLKTCIDKNEKFKIHIEQLALLMDLKEEPKINEVTNDINTVLKLSIYCAKLLFLPSLLIKECQQNEKNQNIDKRNIFLVCKEFKNYCRGIYIAFSSFEIPCKITKETLREMYLKRFTTGFQKMIQHTYKLSRQSKDQEHSSPTVEFINDLIQRIKKMKKLKTQCNQKDPNGMNQHTTKQKKQQKKKKRKKHSSLYYETSEQKSKRESKVIEDYNKRGVCCNCVTCTLDYQAHKKLMKRIRFLRIMHCKYPYRDCDENTYSDKETKYTATSLETYFEKLLIEAKKKKKFLSTNKNGTEELDHINKEETIQEEEYFIDYNNNYNNNEIKPFSKGRFIYDEYYKIHLKKLDFELVYIYLYDLFTDTEESDDEIDSGVETENDHDIYNRNQGLFCYHPNNKNLQNKYRNIVDEFCRAMNWYYKRRNRFRNINDMKTKCITSEERKILRKIIKDCHITQTMYILKLAKTFIHSNYFTTFLKNEYTISETNIPISLFIKINIYKTSEDSTILCNTTEKKIEKSKRQKIIRTQYTEDIPTKKLRRKIHIEKPIMSQRMADFVTTNIKNKEGSSESLNDYKKLNTFIKSRIESYIPSMYRMINEMSGMEWFSYICLENASWRIGVSEKSKTITFFLFDFENKHDFTIVPSELKCKSQIIQAILTTIFEHLISKGNLMIHINHILIYTKDLNSHLKVLKRILCKLWEYKFSINFRKSSFCKKYIIFLRHVIFKDAIRPLPTDINAIVKVPIPTNQKDLESFLMRVNFYNHYIPDIFSLTNKLRTLTNLTKTQSFEWTYKHNQIFEQIKNRFKHMKPLNIPNFEKSFIIRVHTTSEIAAGTLMQNCEYKYSMRKNIKCIRHVSLRLTRKNKKKWNYVLRELYGILKIVRIFYFYARQNLYNSVIYIRLDQFHCPTCSHLSSFSKKMCDTLKKLMTLPPNLIQFFISKFDLFNLQFESYNHTHYCFIHWINRMMHIRKILKKQGIVEKLGFKNYRYEDFEEDLYTKKRKNNRKHQQRKNKKEKKNETNEEPQKIKEHNKKYTRKKKKKECV